MRLFHGDRELKNDETLECYKAGEAPIRIMYTAGHAELLGGMPVVQKVERNPYTLPARGLSGSKGKRISRISGRLGGMGLIRSYGILMKRQEFREKATQIGFVKYR